MKIKTKDLIGAALDWAVAVALGYEMAPVPPDANGENAGSVLVPPGFPSDTWSWPRKGKVAINCFVQPYSANWAWGGPLRDKYRIDVMDFSKDDEPCISASYEKYNGLHSVEGSTALIAICRAVVACELGEEVEVPDELVKAGLNKGEGH